jgi:endonuclease/exonuclease/phosphatase (EEP) superfamily protein YafD
MPLTLTLVTLALVLATLLPMWNNPHWIVRSMDFPRLQLATLAFLLLFFQLWLAGSGSWVPWLLIFITIGVAAWQSWWILPYTFFWPREVAEASGCRPDYRICVITANVLTPNRNARDLIRLVREHRADILVTLESDLWWQKQLDALLSDMPHTIQCPLDNLYGMHVYSRLPLEQSEIAFLVEKNVPSMHTLARLPGGETVQMHFLHPAPPSPTENEASAERDAELIVVARRLETTRQPVIVTGDLNDVAWSPTSRLFRKISGLLDPRVGRGMFNTFHAGYPFFRWPLDHIFHSRHFTVINIQRLPFFGSDHFALATTLCFTPDQNTNSPGLKPDASDQSRAKSIIQEKNIHPKEVPVPND